MTTPVGGGIRSLNVALRQQLDLFVCLRPVRHFPGVPSPLKDPSKTDMVIFRENTEDIYAGIEWEAESDGARKVIDFLQDEMGVRKIRFPETSSIGIKPVSREGTERLVRKAIEYAIANGRDVGHARAQGQHHEVHRGRLPRLGLRARRARVRRDADRRRPVARARARRAHDHDQGRDRRRLPAADPDAAGRVRRDRDAEPERRLHLRRARRPGRRHRHRAGRQPLRRGGDVRGDARHRAEVRRPGQGQPRLADPLGRDDAAPHRLGRGGRPDHQLARRGDLRQAGHVRLRAADGRRERDLDARRSAGR